MEAISTLALTRFSARPTNCREWTLLSIAYLVYIGSTGKALQVFLYVFFFLSQLLSIDCLSELFIFLSLSLSLSPLRLPSRRRRRARTNECRFLRAAFVYDSCKRRRTDSAADGRGRTAASCNPSP